jgi:hypothetical protein
VSEFETPPPQPTEPPDEAVVGWALVRSEEHLKAIRAYLGWMLFLTLASLIAGVIAAYQLAEETSTGF